MATSSFKSLLIALCLTQACRADDDTVSMVNASPMQRNATPQRIATVDAADSVCAAGLRYDERLGCQDVNECRETAPCQLRQDCRNLWGSYMCICHRGYSLDHASGACVDIDECELGYCGSGETCINTDGSFRCLCRPGLKKIGRFCRDVNECTRSPCDDNQYCLNTRGSYQCKCKVGFEPSTNNSCVDTDECQQGMCQAFGEECRNTVGSYECACRHGYVPDAATGGRYCRDVNECELNACPAHSECINTPGSFSCRCHRGFNKHRGLCVDDRECMMGEGSKCQWQCLDIPGSFQCQCPQGYDRSEYACIDRNECDRKQRVCDNANDTCVNTRGSHKCVQAMECPGDGFYRKLTGTDEFGRRATSTNTCRRRCKPHRGNATRYAECRQQPLSVSQHYIEIASQQRAPINLLRVAFPARRRKQRYDFSIASGDASVFGLRAPSSHQARAHLVLLRTVRGPAQLRVKIDLSTYNKRGNMRDRRMLTITVFVSEFEF